MKVTWLFVSITLLATAFLPLMSGCNRSYADRVVSVGPDQLTAAEGPDELEPPALSPMPAWPHEPAASQPDRPAVLDMPENQANRQADKSAQLGGDQPRPPAGEQPSAPSPEETAKTMFHGKIDLVGSDLLRVNADADMTHLAAMMSFTITKDTEILIAGAPATLEDLSEGMTVTVVATKHAGQAIAERIEADPMPV